MRKWSLAFVFFSAFSANVVQRRVVWLSAALVGLMLNAVASKSILALAGSQDMSDVQDRSIPLD